MPLDIIGEQMFIREKNNLESIHQELQSQNTIRTFYKTLHSKFMSYLNSAGLMTVSGIHWLFLKQKLFNWPYSLNWKRDNQAKRALRISFSYLSLTTLRCSYDQNHIMLHFALSNRCCIKTHRSFLPRSICSRR